PCRRYRRHPDRHLRLLARGPVPQRRQLRRGDRAPHRRAVTAESTRTGRYVALLRGINVGGANVIPMTALRASFEALGLLDVTSFIASGNVLFRSEPTDARALASRIEKALSKE